MLLMSSSETRSTPMIKALRQSIAYPAGPSIPPNTIQGFQIHGANIADIETNFPMPDEDMRVHRYRVAVGEKQIATNLNERGWSLVVQARL